MDQRGEGVFVTRQIVTVASTELLLLTLCSCCSILLVLVVNGRSPQHDTDACRCRGTGNGQFRRHVIFGMRGSSSI